MTAMMSLRSRLAMARLAVFVRKGQADVAALARLVKAGVDLLVLGNTGDVDADEVKVRACRTGITDRSLLTATANGDAAAGAAADVVHVEHPGWRLWGDYPRGHQWTLLGRNVSEPRTVRRPGDAWDYLFVKLGVPASAVSSPVLEAAVKRQPPFSIDALPWFVFGDWTRRQVEELISAGARRVAYDGELLADESAADRLRETAELLRQAWEQDPAAAAYRAHAAAL